MTSDLIERVQFSLRLLKIARGNPAWENDGDGCDKLFFMQVISDLDAEICNQNKRDDEIRELVLDILDDWTTNPCRMCGKTHYDGDDKCVNCHIGKKVKAIREALK